MSEFRKAQALIFDCKLISRSNQIRERKVPMVSFYLSFNRISASELNKQFEHWN